MVGTDGAMRFASMCIASPGLGAKEREALARRCALMVCSLLLTTAPAAKPLVMVSGLDAAQLGLLARAGAETVPSPGIGPWNSSGLVWRRRPAALAAAAEPARLYTYHKLRMWDPAFVGARRVAFVDSDAVFVRNGSGLLETVAPPAALYLRDDCKPPNVPWETWDPGIIIDGAAVPKAAAYWNTGVVVYEPDAGVYGDLVAAYRSGDFAALDMGAYVCEGDVLQTYYWRKFRGDLPRPLDAKFNFRGYKCSYAEISSKADVRVVHKEDRRAQRLILDVCEGVDLRARTDRVPALLAELRAALDAGTCGDDRARARVRDACPG